MKELDEVMAQWQRLATAGVQGLGETMEAWRISLGLSDERTTGYAGARCGWYPAKPKRQRRAGPRTS